MKGIIWTTVEDHDEKDGKKRALFVKYNDLVRLIPKEQPWFPAVTQSKRRPKDCLTLLRTKMSCTRLSKVTTKRNDKKYSMPSPRAPFEAAETS